MFNPEQFTATQWHTAEQKAEFAAWFVRFVTKGFHRSMFYRARYQRLCTMWRHIAHFNASGFYAMWLNTTEQRLHFLRNTQRPATGDPRWTWSDVEQALGEWIAGSGLIESYEKAYTEETEARERETLAALTAKYQPPSNRGAPRHVTPAS